MRRYLTALGFIERTKGSHHVFGLPGIARPITLQRDGRRCKVYQVRQVRKLLLENGLRL